MEIKKIAVIGAGTMGSGIAQVLATAGYKTYMMDINENILSNAFVNIEKSVGKLVKKGILKDQDMENVFKNIIKTTDLNLVNDVDFVIEAIVEDVSLKMKLLKDIDRICPMETIFGTNTSSIPITLLGSFTKRPERVIGTHFMNPVPLMKGVEIIKGRLTSEDSLKTTVNMITKIGKVPVVVVDYAGFVTSRLLNIYINEAAYAVMDGNDPEEVDKAMVYCTNMPMGPCKLMDLVGIDVVVNVLKILEDEFGLRFKCAPILKQMVRAGELGMKTKKGFYRY